MADGTRDARASADFERDRKQWRERLLTIDGIGTARKGRLLDATLQEARSAERALIVQDFLAVLENPDVRGTSELHDALRALGDELLRGVR